MNRKIFVYASWEECRKPLLIGTLVSDIVRGSEHFSFAYDQIWLQSEFAQPIDPELQLYAGMQHSQNTQNFRIFLDSCPDRWGRLLMNRREAVIARLEKRAIRKLRESDYLLGVHDTYRMGALRFKLSADGPFLDNNQQLAAPPFTSLPDLENASYQLAKAEDIDDPEYLKWLNMLISPGSSLGGARPKAQVTEKNNLWIAKFPGQNDNTDVGAWEFVAHKLARAAGIDMADCRLMMLNGPYHTFLTQRFDRTEKGRKHFTSSMMQLGYYDGQYEASYIELAEFLVKHGSNTKKDLIELWRRIIFNIAISNTDDHLRNHGFLYQDGGWVLSPAYDLNPTIGSHGLHLNITDSDNALDYDLAMDVIDFFRLKRTEALQIKSQVLASVEKWNTIAAKLGIQPAERQLMTSAFNV